MINKVRLYVNNTKKEAIILSEKIASSLLNHGYIITDENPDLVIGFGGDGTLIHYLNEVKYISDAIYLGINCGTLGFMQDFDVKDINEFVKNIPLYAKETINFLSLTIENDNDFYTFNCLNEFYIQDYNFNLFKGRISIEDELLENFAGSGIIFSTQTGSTARNLSSGGAVIMPGIAAYEMTPSEPTPSNAFRNFPKSICIPNSYSVTLIPDESCYVQILCDKIPIFSGKADSIKIENSDLTLTKLANIENSFITKIREKLI